MIAMQEKDNAGQYRFDTLKTDARTKQNGGRKPVDAQRCDAAANNGRDHSSTDAHIEIVAPTIQTPARRELIPGKCVPARSKRKGHFRVDAQAKNALPPSPSSDGGGGQRSRDARMLRAAPDPIAALRELQATRYVTIRQQNRINNACRDRVRQAMGFRFDLPEAQRKKINAAAEAMVDAIQAGNTPDDPIARAVEPFVIASRESRRCFDAIRANLEKTMRQLAKSLPVCKWVTGVKGFGVLNLAIIVGEAGDLSNYAGPAKLWKRFGLAPYNGKSASRWRRDGGLSADEWTGLGYSPRRCSVAFLLGDTLIKQNGEGEFRRMYDTTKEKRKAQKPDDRPIAIERHARRVMVKEAIKALWCEWHGKTRATKPPLMLSGAMSLS